MCRIVVEDVGDDVVVSRIVFVGVETFVGVDEAVGVDENVEDVDERVVDGSGVGRLGSLGFISAIVDAIRAGDDVVALISVSSSFGRERASATKLAFPCT